MERVFFFNNNAFLTTIPHNDLKVIDEKYFNIFLYRSKCNNTNVVFSFMIFAILTEKND